MTYNLFTSDLSLLHAQILFYREKERNVWASCLLLGLSSDGFNHSWVPSFHLSLLPSLFSFVIYSVQSRAKPTHFPRFESLSIGLSVASVCESPSVRVDSLFNQPKNQVRKIQPVFFFFLFSFCLFVCDKLQFVCKFFFPFFLSVTWMHFYFAYV